LLGSVLEAQIIARTFQEEYNTVRPHSTIGYKVPAEYRAELLRQAPGSGQARQAGPSLRPELGGSPVPNNNHHRNQQPAQAHVPRSLAAHSMSARSRSPAPVWCGRRAAQ
jgi:hypothetical protein